VRGAEALGAFPPGGSGDFTHIYFLSFRALDALRIGALLARPAGRFSGTFSFSLMKMQFVTRVTARYAM
jgi:hypothetical protein